METAKPLKSFVQRNQVFSALLGYDLDVIKTNFDTFSAAFFSLFRSSVVDQNVPHQIGGGRKEFRAIPETRILLFNKAQIRFMHQGRRLKCVIPTLVAHTC